MFSVTTRQMESIGEKLVTIGNSLQSFQAGGGSCAPLTFCSLVIAGIVARRPLEFFHHDAAASSSWSLWRNAENTVFSSFLWWTR